MDHKALPIIDHLRELKRRFAISTVILCLAFGICYHFADVIYNLLVDPLATIYQDQTGRRMIYTGLTEAFFTHIKVAFFAAFILSFPVIAGQCYGFLAPGLYRKEKRVLLPFLIASPILFCLGAMMVYYFIFPLAWTFFLSFEQSGADGTLPIILEARVSEYLSLVMHLIIAFGLAFQLPIILILLAKAGFVTAEGLARKRKYALIAIITIAAMLTPPDIISQIGLAIPMLLLYEISIWGCRGKKKGKEDAA